MATSIFLPLTPPASVEGEIPPMTQQAETWTVARLLDWTKQYLAQHGADSPRLDAEVLLGHAFDCPRIELYARYNEEVPEDVRGVFRELVKQRAAGAPVAYLVGGKEFYSLAFEITRDVLIPRPETETLVLEAIEAAKTVPKANAAGALDVGTGSGAVAVCLAKYSPLKITAVDVSPAALEVAERNAAAHGVADRIEFLQSDLCDALPHEKQYPLIVSNPPYVSEAEYEQLDVEVRKHEPRRALVGGARGDELIRRLADQSLQHLSPGGVLLIELSPMIADAVRSYAEQIGLEDVALVNDLSGRPRVLKARRAE